MRLLRFITNKEKDLLERLSKRSSLITVTAYNYGFDYSGIQYTENKITKCYRNVINNILKEVIEDFVSVNNFVSDGRLRFQYRWSKENSFVGVGYITINELQHGFKD